MKKVILSLSIDEAKILHNGASQERKLELEELFPELKPQLIIDRVKTYEDALRVLGKKDFSRENLHNREIARRKLEIIIEALNEGWKPDFNDIKQSKWYCFSIGVNTCLRFSSSTISHTSANTNFSVHLCLKSKEIADYVVEQFKDLYKEMLLG